MTRSEFVKKAILADPSTIEKLAWSVLAIAAPAFLRWMIDRGTNGVPFVTFFPAVVLVSVFLGWRWAAVVAVGSTLLINYLFIQGGFLKGPNSALVVILLLFAVTCSLLIATGATLRRTVREQAIQEQRILNLHEELQHRVANTLSIVEAIALQTLKSSGPDGFKKAFVGRLHALARANRVLGTGETGTCDMRGLAEKAIEPFCTLRNITLEGPSYHLPNSACTPLTLALHELCTNATKYGALSVPSGTVILTWRLEGTSGATIWWTEAGGPNVALPARKGLGSKLLVPQASITSVQVDYRPEGLWCEIKIAGS